MSHPDRPDRPELSERDIRRGRHRARHSDAAPDPYGGDPPADRDGGAYPDGPGGWPGAGPAAGRPGTGPGWASATAANPVQAPTPTGGWPQEGWRGPHTGPLSHVPDRDLRDNGYPHGVVHDDTREPSGAWPRLSPGSGDPQPAGGAGPTGPDSAGATGPDSAGATGPDSAGGVPPAKGRAGRNLPAAILIGLLLGGVVLVPLLLLPVAFLAVIAVAVVAGTWEMVRALRREDGGGPALLPLLAGGLFMIGLAWYGGLEGLVIGLLLTVVVVMIWRLADGPAGYQQDIAASTLVAMYVPFLGGFAALILHAPDGSMRVLITLAAAVLSDTGGYAVGVIFGRHPMAPSVSPKKSWEGLAGSLAAAALGSALLLALVLDQAWWKGLVFGAAVAAAGVLGDLVESLIKRDLKIKDMSSLLPGHGGVMDRLDSVLFAIPAAYVLLSVLIPSAT